MIADEVSRELVSHSADKIGYLLDQTKEQDRQMIKDGLTLLRNGNVYNVKAEDDLVKATVQDVTPYHVSLQLDSFEMSGCSCPTPGICAHQLAAFLTIYSNFDSPRALVNVWNETEKTIHTNPYMINKAQQKQPDGEALPYKEHAVESWLQYFENTYHTFQKKQSSERNAYRSTHDQLGLIFHKYYSELVKTPPHDPFVNALFRIHASVTALIKLIAFTEENFYKSPQTDYARPFITKISDDIKALLEAIDELKSVANSEEKQAEIISLLHKSLPRFEELLFFSADFMSERLYLFRLIISKLYYQDRAVFSQLEHTILPRIRKKIDTAARTFGYSFSTEYRIALAHFAFMMKNDDLAAEVLQSMDATAVDYTFLWIAFSLESNDEHRSRYWLNEAAEKIALLNKQKDATASRERTRNYLHYYQQFTSRFDDTKGYVQLLKKLLPYSYKEFSEQAVKDGEYALWTELQVVMGYAVSDFTKAELQTVKKAQPELLLPLYHQSIQRHILDKNRPAYQRAVKELRELKALYADLGHEAEWGRFFRALTSEYERLRAFKQELQKGNLLYD